MRVTLAQLREWKRAGRRFAMLTAYDYPTARYAADAGVDALLVGDSLGNVVLGHATTRDVSLDLMIPLTRAVRAGAPDVFLVGDLHYEACRSPSSVQRAAERFIEAGCDAVKIETASGDVEKIKVLAERRICTIAHLGLRPQQITDPSEYRAQARDAAGVSTLVQDARRMVEAGADLLLLEAVPNAASLAVLEAVQVPVIGCGAGPACDGHVVVTHDLVGLTLGKAPKFVPRLADAGREITRGMRRFVESIADGSYPAPEHVYSSVTEPVRTTSGTSPA